MTYQIFSENEWIYPDTTLANPGNTALLYAPRNADTCFQVLTDLTLAGGEAFALAVDGLPLKASAEQLLPAHVGQNSAADRLTTMNYESVKHFVTRQAPFDVYEICRPLDSGVLEAGRAAFYLRLDVPRDALPGEYAGKIVLTIGDEQLVLPVSIRIYAAVVPSLSEANFHMVNWIYYDKLAEQHQVEQYSPEYLEILNAYLDNELDMRNDYLMIPSGVPVRDEAGKVVDFDFSGAEFVGNAALKKGFRYVMGGFSARFNRWDEPDHYLLWDREVTVTSLEGYRQLKLYFTRAWESVVRNGWQEHYMQCLVDEPQFPNSLAYRALSGICRSCMPGVIIHDPVETTDVEGAIDVWVVKQAIFDKYIDTYRALQAMGEEMWIYTCGFPGGYCMNRIIDLPLTVSRLPLWMCYLYDCPGFLHWGYHAHNPEVAGETCYKVGDGLYYPPGNSFVVYPGDGRPWYSVRGHLQRAGSIDVELFRQLGEEKAKELILRVCRNFDDYDPSVEALEAVRKEVLDLLG